MTGWSIPLNAMTTGALRNNQGVAVTNFIPPLLNIVTCCVSILSSKRPGCNHETFLCTLLLSSFMNSLYKNNLLSKKRGCPIQEQPHDTR